MVRRILFGAWVVFCLATFQSLGDDAPPVEEPARQTLKSDLKAQPEFIELGKGERERTNIDSVTSDLPPAIAAAVKKWTGIDNRGQKMTVKFYHTPRNGRFDAMSYASETFGHTSFLKFGDKVLADEETRVRYKELVTVSDEKTFLVVGLVEFDNVREQRRCYVLCQLEGHKPAAGKDDPYIHPTGTATWTGPIVGHTRLPFSDDAIDGKRR